MDDNWLDDYLAHFDDVEECFEEEGELEEDEELNALNDFERSPAYDREDCEDADQDDPEEEMVVLPEGTDESGIPIIDCNGSEDFLDLQTKGYKTLRRKKLSDRALSVYRISKDTTTPPVGLNKTKPQINKREEGEETMNNFSQRARYPQIPGLLGPQVSHTGDTYYVDAETGEYVHADVALRSLQQNRQYRPPQPQQHVPNYQANQGPQYRTYNLTQPIDQGGHRVAAQQRPVGDGYDPTAMYEVDTTHLIQAQPAAQAAPQQNQLRRGGYRVIQDTLESYYTDGCKFVPSVNGQLMAVVYVADDQSAVKKLVVTRGFQMNKNDHLYLDQHPEFQLADELIEAAANSRMPITELNLSVMPTPIEVDSIQTAVLTLTHDSKKANNANVLAEVKTTHTICEIDPAQTAINEAIFALCESEEFTSEYLDMRDTLRDVYPVLVRYIDKKLTKIANNALAFEFRAELEICDTFATDCDELYSLLSEMNLTESFVETVNETCAIEFNFIETEVECNRHSDFTAIEDVETTPMLFVNTEELDGNVTRGVITPKIHPELHEIMLTTLKKRDSLKIASRYFYLTNHLGYTAKILMSNSNVPRMALHSIVEVI